MISRILLTLSQPVLDLIWFMFHSVSFISDHKALPFLQKCQSTVIVMCVFLWSLYEQFKEQQRGSCLPECFATALSFSLWRHIAEANAYSVV